MNDADRPFDISETWERYSFQVGNILFLMMEDRNDGGPLAERGYDEEAGGYSAGKVTDETFESWQEMVEANQDNIVVTCHHHLLQDTTIAPGE